MPENGMWRLERLGINNGANDAYFPSIKLKPLSFIGNIWKVGGFKIPHVPNKTKVILVKLRRSNPWKRMPNPLNLQVPP